MKKYLSIIMISLGCQAFADGNIVNIPAGSSVNVTIQIGTSIPTVSDKTTELPLLFNVESMINLPKEYYAATLQNCKLSANARIDRASTRLMVNLNKLSCINKNGQSTDIDVTGYIVGDDQKQGISIKDIHEINPGNKYVAVFTNNIGVTK